MRRVDKPWGHETIWAETERYVGKLLSVRANESLSRQFHRKKEESLFVLRGEVIVETGFEQSLAARVYREGETFHIAPGTIHRFVAVTDVELMEVSTPELDDVVRIEDAYGRVSGPQETVAFHESDDTRDGG